jgi:hypothetical protein
MKQDVFLGLQMNAPPLNKVVSPSRSTTQENLSAGGVDGGASFREVLASRNRDYERVGSTNAKDEPPESEPVSMKKVDEGESTVGDQVTGVSEERADLPANPEMEEEVVEDGRVLFQVNWAILNLPILDVMPSLSLLPVGPLQGAEFLGRVEEDGDAAQVVETIAPANEQDVPSASQTNAMANNVQSTAEEHVEVPKEEGKRVNGDFTGLLRLSGDALHTLEPSPREEYSGQASTEVMKGEPVLKGAVTQPIHLFKTEVQEGIAIQGTRSHPAATPVQQLVRAVDLLVRMDQSSMRVQLYPESLGRIEVRITQGPQGTGVLMVAEQPQTERLLLTSLNELRQSLAQAGVQLAELAIGQQNARGGFFRQSHGTPQRLRFGLTDLEPMAEAEGMIAPLWLEGPSSIEYRI